jgi:hypothetical protein
MSTAQAVSVVKQALVHKLHEEIVPEREQLIQELLTYLENNERAERLRRDPRRQPAHLARPGGVQGPFMHLRASA